MDMNSALDIVYQAIDTINAQRPADKKLAKLPDLALAGDGGVLDSLGLVTLILTIERKVEESSGAQIDLVGLDVLNVESTEVQTPSSIAQLIIERT